MTEQRIRRLRTKIQESRGRLMESHPSFALLLMYLRFIAMPDMKKMSTNANEVYFSPDFLDKLYPDELDYLLCHQIMHIISGQVWRPIDYANDDYHLACDIVINTVLEEMGFTEDSFPHLGTVQRQIHGSDLDVRDMSPEEVYANFAYTTYVLDDRTRSRLFPGSDLCWGRERPFANGGTVILDIPEVQGRLTVFSKSTGPDQAPGPNGGSGKGAASGADSESGEGDASGADGKSGKRAASETNGKSNADTIPQDMANLREAWHGRAATAFRLTQETASNGVSNLPAFFERMVQKTKSAVLDWRKMLDEFVQEAVADYSFSPPDRRFSDTDFFLPDFNEKEFSPREILFMVDTSGSVEDEALSVVYSEIRGAIEQFNGKLCGQLGFFDAQVTVPVSFETVEDILRIVPYGGGGTDFGVIFDYVRQAMSSSPPSCIVIFTDGQASYPPESAALGIPVLWLIDNTEVTPPWGKVARLIK